MLDGTPVLDIKPYIDAYDQPLLQPSGVAQNYSVEPSGDDTQNYTIKSPGHDAQNYSMEPSGHDAQNYTGAPSVGEEGTVTKAVDCPNTSHNEEVVSIQATSANNDTNLKKVTSDCDSKLKPLAEHSSFEESKLVDKCANTESPDNHETQPLPVRVPRTETVRGTSVADWISQPPIQHLKVRFTTTAVSQLHNFKQNSLDPLFSLTFLKSPEDAKKAITDILEADPRSTYRRKKCIDRLYFFILDTLHITVWFDDVDDVAEVIRVMALSERAKMFITPQD